MMLQHLIFGPPCYVPTTPWRASWAVAATVLIFVAAQLLAAGMFPWLAGMSAAELPAAPMSPQASDMEGVRELMLWLLATQVGIVAMVLLAASLFGGKPRDVLRLVPVDGGPVTVVLALLSMAVLLGSFNVLVYLFRPVDMLADLQLYLGFIRSESWLLAGLAIGLGAPLMEELLFRGFLQSALARSRIGFWPAAALTTAAWTALHWGYSAVGLAEVFLIGLYFAWLLWRTGSLWPALICHALYNSGLMLVLRFAPLPV